MLERLSWPPFEIIGASLGVGDAATLQIIGVSLRPRTVDRAERLATVWQASAASVALDGRPSSQALGS